MANRVPLIINTTANQIQELALGDCLDLTASGIHNAGVITATKFVGDGSLLTNIGGGSAALQDLADDLTPQLGGNLDINGKIINGSGSIVVTGGIQATSFTGDLIGNATSATTANSATTATTATNAAGLTGSPAIQVASVVATGHIQADTVSVASTLTYEDVTSIDSIGIVTARSGIKVLGGGIDAVGTITATAFSGDGSLLTNVGGGINDIVDDTTPQLGGNLDINGKTINGTGNITITGNVTATNLSGSLPASNLTGALPAIDGSALTGVDASPGGSNGEVQYNNGGAFGGSSNFTFDGDDITIADTKKIKLGPNLEIFQDGAGGYSSVISDAYLKLDGALAVSFQCAGQTKFQITPSGNTTFQTDVNVNGTLGGTNVTDSKGDLRRVALLSKTSGGNYDLVASDAGKAIEVWLSANEVTVSKDTFTAGDMVTIINSENNTNITITEPSGMTLRWAGNGTPGGGTGSRSLLPYGMATIYFMQQNTAIISGAGLS